MSGKPHHSLLFSIFNTRCPRCRDGKMFTHRLYSVRFMEMNKECPCCGQRLMFEPGFFLGSAFFSYFINAVLLIGAALVLYYSDMDVTVGIVVASVIAIVFGLLPITLRLSKSMWIHIFVKYEGPSSKILSGKAG